MKPTRLMVVTVLLSIAFWLPGSAPADPPPAAASTTAPAAASPPLDDAAVAKIKQGWIDDLKQKIAGGQRDIRGMPAGSQKRELADSIRQSRHTLESIEDMDFAAVRTEIKRHADAEAQQRVADAQRRADEQELLVKAEEAHAAARQAKFPNWHGAWRTCPFCNGTGRDADAEREENTRQAGVVGSMYAGTNTMVKIPGAVVQCPVCGGAGEVPDTR
jgi:DnaJ-class molecular chaperone